MGWDLAQNPFLCMLSCASNPELHLAPGSKERWRVNRILQLIISAHNGWACWSLLSIAFAEPDHWADSGISCGPVHCTSLSMDLIITGTEFIQSLHTSGSLLIESPHDTFWFDPFSSYVNIYWNEQLRYGLLRWHIGILLKTSYFLS